MKIISAIFYKITSRDYENFNFNLTTDRYKHAIEIDNLANSIQSISSVTNKSITEILHSNFVKFDESALRG